MLWTSYSLTSANCKRNSQIRICLNFLRNRRFSEFPHLCLALRRWIAFTPAAFQSRPANWANFAASGRCLPSNFMIEIGVSKAITTGNPSPVETIFKDIRFGKAMRRAGLRVWLSDPNFRFRPGLVLKNLCYARMQSQVRIRRPATRGLDFGCANECLQTRFAMF